MESIIYFLFWAGLIFIMMRFGCGSHVMGHGKSGASRGEPSGSVQPRTAKSAVHDGHVYYFCSRECRERFEAAPDSYLAAAVPASLDMREQADG